MRKSLLFLAAAALSTAAFAQDAVQLAPGEYFIRNVKTGKFLNADYTWSTKGVVKDQARAFTVTAAPDGGYILKSSLGNFKPENELWMDGGDEAISTLEKSGEFYNITVGDKVLTVGNEPLTYNDDWGGFRPNNDMYSVAPIATADADKTNDAAKWEFLTLAQMSEKLAAATETTPIDATFYIKAHDIPVMDKESETAWNMTLGGQPWTIQFLKPGDWGVARPQEWINKWQWVWYNVDATEDLFEMGQAVEGARPGFYRADYLLIHQNTTPATLTFNDKEAELYEHDGNDLWVHECYETFTNPTDAEKSCIFEVKADGKLNIKFVKENKTDAQNRFAFKRVLLNYLGTEEPNSGIEGVAMEAVEAEAPAEYYNMQGIRVAEPTTGLYIVRQGNKVSKQLIRK